MNHLTPNGPPPLPPRSPGPPHGTPESVPPYPQPPPVPPRPPGYEDKPPARRPVTDCLDVFVTFTTDWYWHPESPEFPICSHCFAKYIHATQFAHLFETERLSDGKPRVCRFSKPRMRDHLWKEALASGDLGPVLAWMQRRATIPHCKGVDGVKGDVAAELGVRWFAGGIQFMISSSKTPATFLACEACYEDHLLAGPFALQFGPHDRPQPADAVWACDVAVPYIPKMYEKKSEEGDWPGFVECVKSRLAEPPCPGATELVSFGRSWYVPKPETGAGGIMLCYACFCDSVAGSGAEEQWEWSAELSRSYKVTYQARCAVGSAFNMRILLAATYDKEKSAVNVWDQVVKLSTVKPCDPEGIADGTWYTLPSQPKEFGVCAACYVGMLEPLQVTQFFVPRTDVPRGARLLCSFNQAQPRFSDLFARLFEMYLTLDPTSMDTYASEYAAVTRCARDEDVKNQRWYGWLACTICPECYLDFARQSPLAAMMELRDTLREESTVCELYSPRMRNLYTECATSTPPDPRPILEYSVQRRAVYIETVPRIRMIIFQAKMEADQARFLGMMGSYYTSAGQMQQSMYGRHYDYGSPGLGYGFANISALEGARYNREAAEMSAGVGMAGRTLMVGELEKRWRAVE